MGREGEERFRCSISCPRESISRVRNQILYKSYVFLYICINFVYISRVKLDFVNILYSYLWQFSTIHHKDRSYVQLRSGSSDISDMYDKITHGKGKLAKISHDVHIMQEFLIGFLFTALMKEKYLRAL